MRAMEMRSTPWLPQPRAPWEYEWGYDEEEKNQLEIERLEEQVGAGVGGGGGFLLGFPGASAHLRGPRRAE